MKLDPKKLLGLKVPSAGAAKVGLGEWVPPPEPPIPVIDR